ncbi:hypothetical protein FQZ97_1010510 [compost metagenome]
MFGNQAIAQQIEFFGQLIVAVQHSRRVSGHLIRTNKVQIVGLGLFETVFEIFARRLLGNTFLQQLKVTLPGCFEGGGIVVFAEHDDQLITQGLAKLEPPIQGDEVVAHQRFLAPGHLQHTDKTKQQAQQCNSDQRGNAEKKPGLQLHRQFHRR